MYPTTQRSIQNPSLSIFLCTLVALLALLVPNARAEPPQIFEPSLGHGSCAFDANGQVVCSQCDIGWGGSDCQSCTDPTLCGPFPPSGYAKAGITRYHQQAADAWTMGIFPESLPYRSFITLPPVDTDALFEEDERRGWDNRWAVILPTDLNSARNGRWVNLADGGRVWTVGVQSTGALAMSVLFDQLTLAPGAQLWVYTKRAVHGPIVAEHLGQSDGTGTPPLWGDAFVIELYEPTSGSSHVGAVDLAHGYRGMQGGGNGDCQIDVHCYNGAENVANAVAMILKHGGFGSFWCSAAAINNQDGDPLVLTAEHCLFEDPADYWDYLKDPDEDPSADFFINTSPTDPTFIFQYRNQGCSEPGSDDSEETSIWEALSYHGGLEVIHHDHETDTALVRLDLSPSPQCITYAGYDAFGVVPNYTAGISHPDGKLAKLSIDWDPPTIIDMEDDDPEIDANYVEDDTIWKVNLEEGFIEGGSSGSPLFDHTGRIIGALSGHIQPNPSYCASGIDFVYGRLKRAYDLSTDLASALSQVRKLNDAGSTISKPTPLQKLGTFDACIGMVNSYAVNPKVAEHFDIQWQLLSDHGSIVGPSDERTVQVSLGWQATEVELRVRVISTDPSCEYHHEKVVTYPAYGCESI